VDEIAFGELGVVGSAGVKGGLKGKTRVAGSMVMMGGSAGVRTDEEGKIDIWGLMVGVYERWVWG
jgi:hypothetical protein